MACGFLVFFFFINETIWSYAKQGTDCIGCETHSLGEKSRAEETERYDCAAACDKSCTQQALNEIREESWVFLLPILPSSTSHAWSM